MLDIEYHKQNETLFEEALIIGTETTFYQKTCTGKTIQSPRPKMGKRWSCQVHERVGIT
jgi:hypothetical protein